MLRKHRNALLDLVRAANLDPRLFEASGDTDPHSFFNLSLVGSPLYFAVTTERVEQERKFHYSYTQYDRHLPNKILITRPPYWGMLEPWLGFEQVETGFGDWLKKDVAEYLVDKAEEAEDRQYSDLWAELSLPAGSAEDLQVLPNTPFSASEQTRIADALREFEDKVKSQDLLSEDQVKLLHEQVEYLISSSKRLGRKDWVMAATGALFSFTLSATLTGQTATQVLHLAGAGLQWIVVHLPMLPR